MKFKKLNSVGYLLICLFFSTKIFALNYDYPFKDPYQSSLLSTASMLMINEEFKSNLIELAIPNRFPQRNKLAFIGNRIESKVLMSMHQSEKRPLVIVMGGLGAAENSGTSLFYQQLLFQSGFHTMSVASPFFWKMNLSQFESATPGNMLKDQKTLYEYLQKVIQKARTQHDLQYSKVHLVGYSMGGLQAIFLADYDKTHNKIGFEKILAINPPVNPFSAMEKIDELFPYWVEQAPAYREKLISKIYHMVFSIAENPYENGLDQRQLESILNHIPFSSFEIKSLIAYTFNETLGNTIFTSELVRRRGILKIDPDHYSPQPWLRQAKTESFSSYFKKFLYPDMKKDYPDLNIEELIYRNSLESKADLLKRDANISIFHNSNDIILTKKGKEFLRATMPKDRLKMYPLGGHLGNVWYANNVRDFLMFFED